jgi:hypothetical protein
MRYNPATDRALTIDEIAEQCRRAIMKANEPKEDTYAEVLEFARWENDMLVAA